MDNQAGVVSVGVDQIKPLDEVMQQMAEALSEELLSDRTRGSQSDAA